MTLVSRNQVNTQASTSPIPKHVESWEFAGRALVAALVAALCTVGAEAQTRPTQRPPVGAPSSSGVSFRGFADFGSTTFTASESFDAILGSARGNMFGGGVEFIEHNVFLNLRASRYRQTGERVFISGDDRFNLGINTTVTVRPIELTVGYRVGGPRWRLVPYGGGGIGWHKYTETSEFATDEENVDETQTGFHVVGGAEYRVARYVGAAAEVQWTTVPDAIGQDANGVSREFGETDLGGVTFRVKVVIGR